MKETEYNISDIRRTVQYALLWTDSRLQEFLKTLNDLSAQKGITEPKDDAKFRVAMLLDLDKLEQDAISVAKVARTTKDLGDLADSVFETTALIRTKLSVSVANLIRKPNGIDGDKLFNGLEKKYGGPAFDRVKNLILGLVND